MIVFTKDNIHFIHTEVIIQCLHQDYMALYKWSRWNPSNKTKKGSENLVLPPRVTSAVTCYQATC